MPLQPNSTSTVSSQSKFSGQTGNSFAKTGNSLTSPMPVTFNGKNSSLYSPYTSIASPTVQSVSALTEENLSINAKSAVSNALPEPLATFYIRSNESNIILAALYQAVFEDKCSLEFARRMFQLLQEKNDKIIPDIRTAISAEIKSSKDLLDGIENLSSLLEAFNEKMNVKQSDLAKNFATEQIKQYKLDKLITRTSLTPTMLDVLNTLIPKRSTPNDNLYVTTQAMQLLHFCADFFRTGCSPHLLYGSAYSPEEISKELSKRVILRETTRDKQNPDLPVLSVMGVGVSQNFIAQITNGQGNLLAYSHTHDQLRLPSLNSINHLDASAYFAAMLANEFAISAGLGRLESTELSTKFSIGTNYVNTFFGVDSVDSALDESTINSLSDYLLVGNEGSNSISPGEKGVMLLEGSNFKNVSTESGKRHSCYTAFVKDMLRNPTSKDKNRTPSLEKATNACQKTYEAGNSVMNKLYLLDSDVSLLSPKGLYLRILKEFSTALKNFSDTSVDNRKAREIAMLSHFENRKGTVESNFLKEIVIRNMCFVAFRTINKIESDKFSEKSDILRFTPDDSNMTVFKDVSLEAITQSTKDSSKTMNTNIMKALSNPVYLGAETPDFIARPQDPSEKSFLYGSLVNVFVDLHKEADKASKKDKGDASFVDFSRRTKNSKIDACISLAMILEIAVNLSSMFVSAVPFYWKTATFDKGKNEPKFTGSLSDLFYNWAGGKSNFKEDLVNFYFDPKGIAEKQATLDVIITAVENNDFSSILTKSGDAEIVPALDGVDFNSEITGTTLKISDFRDLFERLSLERNLPAIAFASIKSRVDYTSNVSQPIVNVGKQLLGLNNQEDDYKAIADFANTTLGKKFLESFDAFDIDVAKTSLSRMNSSLNTGTGRLPKISMGEYNCIKKILPILLQSGISQDYLFTVTALPKNFINHSVDSSFSLKKDEVSLENATLLVNISKNPVFSNQQYKSKSTAFFTRRYIDSYSFDVFESAEPIDLNDIVQKVSLTNGETGLEFLKKKAGQQALEILKNECVSYLIRKMFSILSSTDLMEENVTDTSFDTRSNSAAQLAREFASVYGLPSSTFDSAFNSKSNFLVIDRESMKSLSVDTFQDLTDKIVVKKAPLTFGEAELFFDLFSSIHFMTGQISSRILTPCYFDRILGVLHNGESFEKTVPLVTEDLEKIEFDTYDVNVSQGPQI